MTAGTEVSWVQLYRRSRGQARHRAQGTGSVQATYPRDHVTDQGRQHADNNRRAGSVHAGLTSYFGYCETHEVLVSLTRRVRLRLGAAMWRQWKTLRRRREAMFELEVRLRLARNTAGSGLGPWYLAKAKALSVGLSNAYFKSLGLPSLVGE